MSKVIKLVCAWAVSLRAG